MDASSLCFVINAKSHRVARDGSWLEAALPDAPGAHVLRFEEFDVLEARVSELALQGVRRFFVEGGDGTVLAVLSACAENADAFASPPEYALLPGGSTNLAYKTVGFSAKSARHFRKRLKALMDGADPVPASQHALSVSIEGQPTAITGFVLSTGALARAMSYVQQEFHGDGHRGSLDVAKAIFRFLIAPQKYLDRDGLPVLRGTHLKMRAGGANYDSPHGLGLATSLPSLSLGIRPFWGAGPGGISYTYTRWPLRHFRSGLIGALLRKNPERLEQKGFFSLRTDRIEMQTDDRIMIDGEIFIPSPESTISVTCTEPKRFLI